MIKEGVICHAEGPRCLGCDHYHGRAPVCVYAPRPEQQVAPTPRTDALYDDLERQAESGALRHNDVRIRKEEHARQLERELSAARAEADRLREALEKVERWQFPPTGKFWESGNPVSYIAAYGSNGERDYMREVARAALAATRKEGSNG